MTNGAKALSALAVAAVLGAAYWGWTVKLKPAREAAAAEAKKPFSGLAADATQEILLRKRGGSDVLLRKTEGAWRLLKPIQAPADPAAVEALVKGLADLSREEIIAEKDAELRQYGLLNPSGAATFVPATPGAKAKALFFGDDNPTGTYAYAMVDGETQVFLCWLSAKTAILRDAAELRDKAVWSFDSAELLELSSSVGGGFSVKRGDKAGWVVKSAAGSEDGMGGAIERWLGELAAFKAVSVPSEDGKGGAFGLAKGPHLRLRFKDGRQLELHAGATAKDGGVYAQGKPGTPVFVLPSSATLTLMRPAHELADHQAFALESSLVERFEIRRPDGTLTAVKANGAWSWQGLPAKGKEFDFSGFISRFAGAAFLKRLAAAEKPKTAAEGVYFYNAGGTLLESAEFGPKRDGGRLAVSGTKHLVSIVTDDLLEGLPPAQAPAKAAP